MRRFIYYLNNIQLIILLLLGIYGITGSDVIQQVLGFTILLVIYQMIISFILLFHHEESCRELDFHFVLSTLYFIMALQILFTDVEFNDVTMALIIPTPLIILCTYGLWKIQKPTKLEEEEKNILFEKG